MLQFWLELTHETTKSSKRGGATEERRSIALRDGLGVEEDTYTRGHPMLRTHREGSLRLLAEESKIERIYYFRAI
ncbi:hypothetical protein SLE2022_127980 [Rubroshorea leprosula]